MNFIQFSSSIAPNIFSFTNSKPPIQKGQQKKKSIKLKEKEEAEQNLKLFTELTK